MFVIFMYALLMEQVGDFQVKGSGLQPKHFQPQVGESSGVYAALSKDNGKSVRVLCCATTY